MSGWIHEPQTAMETRIELIAIESELRTAKAQCCDKQAEVMELEADRLHLIELLDRQTVGQGHALASRR